MVATSPPVIRCTLDECRHIAKQAYTTFPLLKDDQDLVERARVFQALGNETRLKILGLLAVQDLCMCDITTTLESAASTITHHLRMLQDANLIVPHQEGRFTVYSLNREPLEKHRVFE